MMKDQHLKLAWFLAFMLPTLQAFDVSRPHYHQSTVAPRPSTTSLDAIHRREALTGMLSIVGGLVTATAADPTPSARADVSSGDMPQSAAQFNRIVRLKRDLKV